MKMYQYEIPDLFLKFSTNREYLEDLKNGRLFMNESGYFRNLEDHYRGDRHDGKCPVSLKPFLGESLKIGLEDTPEEQFEIPISCVKDFVVGFEGDDKIPIYCCSVLSEENVEQVSSTCFRISDKFLNEMKQFGNYAALFYGNELVKNVLAFAKEKRLHFIANRVSYTNIESAYTLDSILHQPRDIYEPFFIKDVSYCRQNEWRLVLQPNVEPLIEEDKHFFIAQLAPLKFCHIVSIEYLEQSTINIYNSDEEEPKPKGAVNDQL